MGEVLTYSTAMESRWRKLLIRGIELGTGGRKINRLYSERLESLTRSADVWSAAIALLKIRVKISNRSIQELRGDRPLVVVANHPFGVVDGIVLCQLVSQMRPDFRVLINAVFEQVEAIRPFLLPIDFQEGAAAMATNLDSRKEALATLRRGGAIAIFPSGGVSTREGLFGRAIDSEWKRFTAKLIRSTKADVLPVYFHGENSWLFQLVSQFSQTLRLSLLIHEMRRRIGTEINLTLGEPIRYEQLDAMTCRQQLVNYLRTQTYALEVSQGERGFRVGNAALDSPWRRPIPGRIRNRLNRFMPHRSNRLGEAEAVPQDRTS